MTTPFYKRTKRERRDVEEPAIKYAHRRGWWHIKVTSPTCDSLPDDLFVRNGEYLWIEFKAEGQSPSVKQAKRHKEMRERGMDVRWTDDPVVAERWLK